MELLQRKLRRCLSLLESHAETISALTAYHEKIQEWIPADASNLPYDITANLDECKQLNVHHTRKLRELLQSAESTRRLVCPAPKHHPL